MEIRHACAGYGYFAKDMAVLEMNDNPLNPARLEPKQLKKLCDRNEMLTDEIVNFQLGLAQLDDMHVWQREDRQWLLVNTFFSDKLRKG